VETKAHEIAIVSLDGRPAHLMTPWQIRVYWKVATRIDVERIDVTDGSARQRPASSDDRAQPSDHRQRNGGREP